MSRRLGLAASSCKEVNEAAKRWRTCGYLQVNPEIRHPGIVLCQRLHFGLKLPRKRDAGLKNTAAKAGLRAEMCLVYAWVHQCRVNWTILEGLTGLEEFHHLWACWVNGSARLGTRSLVMKCGWQFPEQIPMEKGWTRWALRSLPTQPSLWFCVAGSVYEVLSALANLPPLKSLLHEMHLSLFLLLLFLFSVFSFPPFNLFALFYFYFFLFCFFLWFFSCFPFAFFLFSSFFFSKFFFFFSSFFCFFFFPFPPFFLAFIIFYFIFLFSCFLFCFFPFNSLSFIPLPSPLLFGLVWLGGGLFSPYLLQFSRAVFSWHL